MSEHVELLERFRRAPELLAAAMIGAAGEVVDFKPGPDKWSVRQILCHLADSELVDAMRYRQVIAEEKPLLQAFDQNAWTANLDYSRRKASHVIESFRRLRTENYELLKDLPDSAYARTGIHSERGPVSLAGLLRTYTEHAERHIVQIRAVRAAYKEAKGKATQ
jgi:DinB superfamily